MKTAILFLAIIFSISVGFPQTVLIKVKYLDDTKTVLSSLQGEKLLTVDSIISDKKGEFHFSLQDKHLGFLSSLKQEVQNNKIEAKNMKLMLMSQQKVITYLVENAR